MEKETTENIIVSYLRQNRRNSIKSSDIEQYIPSFGRDLFGVWHNPGTYSRAWRMFKEPQKDGQFRYKKYGIVSIDLIDNSKQHTWRINWQ